jgi:trehalose-6-phosphate synthase
MTDIQVEVASLQVHDRHETASPVITKLTADTVAKFLPLSAKGVNSDGRIIHVTHQIPFNILRKGSTESGHVKSDGLPSPPGTPPRSSSQWSLPDDTVTTPNQAGEQWTFTHRRGHSAMHSGIHSVSQNRDSLHIGWTGTIHEEENKRVIHELTEKEKKELTQILLKQNSIVPIFLNKKQSHNHYEGYCKSSELSR